MHPTNLPPPPPKDHLSFLYDGVLLRSLNEYTEALELLRSAGVEGELTEYFSKAAAEFEAEAKRRGLIEGS